MRTYRDSLCTILNPKSVAVIGASDDLSKISGRPLKYLIEFGYDGRILPVNPKYTQIAGIPCYPSIDDIEGDIDLAVVGVPANAALGVLQSCAKRGVGSSIVFSSGFAEMGMEGRVAQEKIGALASETGMRICGPNSLGVVNLATGMTASFSQTLERKPASGPVGFITQSGAFGTFLFGMALESGLTFKYFISSGNEADLEFCDYTDYLIDDPEIRVIAGYIEGLKSGAKLKHVARKAARAGKPLVIVKVGRSSAGTRAAKSHTGSMTGSDAVYDAVFDDLGIIRAETEEQLLDFISAFLSNARLPGGRGLGIVTQSGGAGVLSADRAEMVGLVVPELQQSTRQQLTGVVPRFGSTGNPVDITAQFIAEPTLLHDSIAIIDRDPGVNSMLFCLGLMDLHWRRVVSELEGLAKTVSNPLFVSWSAAPKEALGALRAAGVPVFSTPTRAVDAVAAVVDYGSKLEALQRVAEANAKQEIPPEVKSLIETARREGRDHLLEYEAKKVLAGFGVSVPRGDMASSVREAEKIAEALGFPVVLKVQAVGLLHKSEARVIELNVANGEQLRAAYERTMANAKAHCPPETLKGVLVEEMIQGGVETIAGLTYDPMFGPVLLFGLGGIFTEVLRDTALAVCPLGIGRAESLIRSLKSYPILAGARGRARGDLAAMAETLEKISRMAVSLEGVIAELDVNPLIVLSEGLGVCGADALITLAGNHNKEKSNG